MKKKIVILGFCFLTLVQLPALADYDNSEMDRLYDKALSVGCDKIIVKDAKTASALSLLPGGGSFYTGSPVMGLLAIPFWPFSVAWEIPTSTTRAHIRNKAATVLECEERGLI